MPAISFLRSWKVLKDRRVELSIKKAKKQQRRQMTGHCLPIVNDGSYVALHPSDAVPS